jgi:hypothetical protein
MNQLSESRCGCGKLTPMATMVQTLNERRERREREWWERVLAVIAEFGAQRRHPLLVPEDDPGNDATLLRLAGEILFLRDQLQRIATAVEWAQAGKPSPSLHITYLRVSVCLILLGFRRVIAGVHTT